MFLENEEEQSDIADLLTGGTVEVGGERFEYSFEEKVVVTDRAFTIQEEKNNFSYLFSLTPREGKGQAEVNSLKEIKMQDSQVYGVLIKEGMELMKRVESELITSASTMDLFTQEVELNGKKFSMIYHSSSIKIVGISLRENYEKRLRGRIQG